MARKSSWLILGVLAGMLCLPSTSQTLGSPQPGFDLADRRNALTCTRPEHLTIPKKLYERAKLKTRLADLLRESLYDDAKGIVNIAREKEIRNLADKVRKP